jgi:hypothetical protein
MKKSTCIFLLLPFIFSCCLPNYAPVSQERAFRNIERTILTDNTLLDTTVIYYLKDHNEYRDSDKYKVSEHYIRFYSDGRCKQGFILESKKLNADDVNSVRNGSVGYYLIEGSVIKIALYLGVHGISTYTSIGLIDEDKNLIILNEQTSMFPIYTEKLVRRRIDKTSYLNPMRYEKVKVEGMEYIPPIW